MKMIIKSRFEINYFNDKELVKKEKFYKDGKLKSECFYNNNKKHYAYKEYYADGSLKKLCYYQHGKLHGVYEEYKANSRELIKRYYYECGKRHGSLTIYTEDKVYVAFYMHDELVSFRYCER